MERNVFLSILLVFVFAGFVFASDANLVGEWEFDECGGAIAYDSAGSSDGIIYGASWWDCGGDPGLSFDGFDDYVDCGMDESLRMINNLSLSFWFRSNRIYSGESGVVGTWKADSPTESGYGVIYTNDGHLEVIRPINDQWHRLRDTVRVSDGKWHYVAAVYEPTNTYLYIDGVLRGSVIIAGTVPLNMNTPSKLTFGGDIAGDGAFRGQLDSVRIYNKPLSAEEVRGIYFGEMEDLAELGVVGTEILRPDLSYQYKAVLYFKDGSTEDVSGMAAWSVEPDTYASIDENGLLRTSNPDTMQYITVSAHIAAGSIVFDAQKDVKIAAHRKYVPDDFLTIQAAIDASFDGDTVVVADGVYSGVGNRNIDLKGKAITVRSENGAENCIIDGENSSRGFYFHNNETASSVLDGFTIRNGHAGSGGGVYCKNSSPVIRNLIISNCAAGHGGGIYCENSSPTITGCMIINNTASVRGGGVYGCSGSIANCVITLNTVSDGYGGGMYGCSGPITNCTITNNTASHTGGVYGNAAMTNCILWGNVPGQINSNSVSYSAVEGGWDGIGNIDSHPQLEADGYHLKSHSLCINAGDPDGDYGLQVDIDGEVRVAAGRVDIGADEFLGDRPAIIDIQIQGDEGIMENSSSQYRAFASYDGGGTAEVTAAVNWSVEGNSGVSIDERGLLTAGHIESGNEIVISAWYVDGDSTVDTELVAGVVPMVELEITGSGEIRENSIGQYAATAFYEGGYTADITAAVNWSVEGDSGVVINGGGLLTAGHVESNNDIIVTARYIQGGQQFEPEVVISVVPLVEIAISGSSQITRRSKFQYGLTAYYADGNDSEVGAAGQWRVEPNDVVSIDSNGLLRTPFIVEEAADLTVYARYAAVGVTLESGFKVRLRPPVTLRVPGEYETIQAAIDAAGDGDIVAVADGRYRGDGNRDIDFLGKAITVRSENGAENCIIDCEGTDQESHRGFYFHSGEDNNSILEGFTITGGNHYGGGGGIYCEGASPVITDCIITANRTDRYGGGIYCRGTNPVILNCVISGNEVFTRGSGGGIACFGEGGEGGENYVFTISNCTISGNVTDDRGGGGGGIRCDGDGSGTFNITDCTIADNIAGFGGGIYAAVSYRRRGYPSGKFTVNLSNCTISGNVAGRSGGGVCGGSSGGIGRRSLSLGLIEDGNEKAKLNITNCTISENLAGSGGGVYCANMDCNIEDSLISSNRTNGDRYSGGGGISCGEESSLTMDSCVVSNNWAIGDEDVWGGGIICWDRTKSVSIKNCLITGNRSLFGGALFCWERGDRGAKRFTLSNCTISGNLSMNGGAVSTGLDDDFSDSVADINNCILWGNFPEQISESGVDISVSYSDVEGGWEGVGNIDMEPGFVDAGFWDANGTPSDANDDIWVEGDYRLLRGSDCINAGDPAFVAGANETDLDGFARVIGGRVDVGAYEYEPPIEVEVKVMPRRIVRHSRSRRIVVQIRLPEGIAAEQVDTGAGILIYPGGIGARRVRVFSGGSRVRITAAFYKSMLLEAIGKNGKVELEVEGMLTTGQKFYGVEDIRISGKRF